MNCTDLRQLLSAQVDGEIPALPEEALRHLEGCADCREAQTSYAAVDKRLQALLAAPIPSASRYRFPEKVQELQPRRRVLWLGSLMAATVALAVAAWRLAQQAPSPGSGQGTATTTASGPAPTTLPGAVPLPGGGQAWVRPGTRYQAREGAWELEEGALHLRLGKGGGPLRIQTPHGQVLPSAGVVAVTVTPAVLRVAVGEGQAELSGPGGRLALAAGQAGDLLAAQRGAAQRPEMRADLSVAGETLWRPWPTLDPAERLERLACLRSRLGQADSEESAQAAELLREGGVEGQAAAAQWWGGAAPTLQAGLLRFWSGAAAGDPAARAALAAAARDGTLSSALRIAAARGLGMVGTAADRELLVLLQQAGPGTPVDPELARAAAEAAERILQRQPAALRPK